jgi:ABC-type ATPase involved in cell division
VFAEELAVGRNPAAPRLADVRLTVAAGERIAVLGGNGVGKTLLLETLALMRRPLAGRLRVLGTDVGEASSRERAGLRRRIGAAFGEDAWIADGDAVENLALPLQVHGEGGADVRTVVSEFLAWLGLAADRGSALAALSPGERRLLAVARAAITRPRLVVLDEPLAGLDDRARERVAQLVGELTDLGAAVVVGATRHETARRLGCEPLAIADGRLRVGAGPLRAAS